MESYETSSSTQQQVFKQLDRAGSSKDQAAVAVDVGTKKLSDGGHGDQRYRTGGEDQEGAVQDGQTGRAPGDTA